MRKINFRKIRFIIQLCIIHLYLQYIRVLSLIHISVMVYQLMVITFSLTQVIFGLLYYFAPAINLRQFSLGFDVSILNVTDTPCLSEQYTKYFRSIVWILEITIKGLLMITTIKIHNLTSDIQCVVITCSWSVVKVFQRFVN